jgi:CIC family chloride channel protein
MFGVATVVGVGTGLGALFFIYLIGVVQRLLFNSAPLAVPTLGRGWLLLAPVLGGMVAGPIIAFVAKEAKGHGVPEVMEAMALKGGRIRPRVVVAKVLASAACIGSGGSAGREGPIVQVGAALGSTFGQVLHFSEERIRTLVAAGAAAGIAATFNAPIAGVIFSIEIILGELRLGDLGSVVISAVVASVVARTALGDRPAFTIPEHTLVSPWEILLYLLLGLLSAFVGVLFIKLLYYFEDVFDNAKFHDAFKPAVGGILLGGLALLTPVMLGVIGVPMPTIAGEAATQIPLPPIFGAGFGAIEAGLTGKLVVGALLLFMFLKLLATSFTLGSGNSGGVFAPGLYSGAMLGSAFGWVAGQLLPGIVAGPGAYATVGMAAVFAAAARAPLTGVLIVFEMTDDYRIILPLMVAVVTATVVAQHIHPESIYTFKLVRRGIRLSRGRDVDVMDSVRVDEVMRPPTPSVDPGLKASELGQMFLATNCHAFPVVNGGGRLHGMVSLTDLRQASDDDSVPDALTVDDITTRRPVVAYPDESVRAVLERMAPRDLSRLPVVARDDPEKLLGVVRRNDVVRAYEIGTVRRHRGHVERNLPAMHGANTEVFLVEEGAPIVGSMIKEVAFPRQCVVVSIERAGEVILPHGETAFQPHDRVTLLVKDLGGQELLSLFRPADDHAVPAVERP